MAYVLPPIPRFIFAICEPISLLAGAVTVFLSPASFVADQMPNNPPSALPPSQLLVALQLGNMYLLVGLIGVAVLYTTTSPHVARCYIFSLLLGDIGHLAVTYRGMGRENFYDVANWTSVAWGNIGITGLLFLMRGAYLLGLLGKSRELTKPKSN